MKRIYKLAAIAALSVFSFSSCQNDSDNVQPERLEVPASFSQAVQAAGFDHNDILALPDGGYIVEGDIFLTEESIKELQPSSFSVNEEQYHTDALVSVNGSRTIKVYMPTSFNSTYQAALQEAVDRYNAEGLTLTFQKVSSSSGADITFATLPWWQEWFGVLGSAGFPSGGNPFNSISMNRNLQTSYGYSQDGIATVIAHEMGHCIGFRHTDYFDRSVSCGGSTNNEGDGGVGANHIPGTPTGATVAAGSFMLACSGGGDRPFNADDKTALDYLY